MNEIICSITYFHFYINTELLSISLRLLLFYTFHIQRPVFHYELIFIWEFFNCKPFDYSDLYSRFLVYSAWVLDRFHTFNISHVVIWNKMIF